MTEPYTGAKRVFIPLRKHHTHFTDRQRMKHGHPIRRFKAPPLPAPALPIDWAKTLDFPMDGNDQYGDCMYAAACHADGTFTGNAGTESVFDQAVLIKDYLALSGGDNGLSEGMILGEWKNGLVSTPAANILDALDIDPTDAALVQSAIYLFGGLLFMLDVPDTWVQNFNTGAVWDAPAVADQNNGHGIWWNGVDAQGRYKLQTWGTYGWITPAGVAVCDPTAFIVFSLRWFNAAGVAPNGMTYDQLAALWVQCGGAALPPSPFVPTPTPGPTPTPPPTPVPVPVPTPVPVPVPPPMPPPTPTPVPVPVPPPPTPGPGPVEATLLATVDEGFADLEEVAGRAARAYLKAANMMTDKAIKAAFGQTPAQRRAAFSLFGRQTSWASIMAEIEALIAQYGPEALPYVDEFIQTLNIPAFLKQILLALAQGMLGQATPATR